MTSQSQPVRFSTHGSQAVTVVGGRPEDPYARPSGEITIVGGRPEDNPLGSADSFAAQQPHPRLGALADLTLVNVNLLRFNLSGRIDHEVHPPLGLLYLVSVLERAEYAVDYVDLQLHPLERPDEDPFDLAQAAAWIGEVSDVVGLGCMVNLLPFTLLLAKVIKTRNPQVKIVLGGVGPFGVEEKILTEFPWIDVVVRGEAEDTILELLPALRGHLPLDAIQGISFRNLNGVVVRNLDRPRILDLDTIPFPAYHRLDIRHYNAFNIVTNRGCPYPCTFCSAAPIWNRKTTCRSHENVIAEIRHLHETYGVNHVLFQDEFFYTTERRMLDFCDQLIASGLNVTWKCFGRVNLVTEKAMRRMAEAGCIQLRFGIESGSDRVLKHVSKAFDTRQANAAVALAKGIFPSVETFFMWGFPFEDMDDLFRSAIIMERYRDMGVHVLPSLLSLMPQTRIYQDFLAGHYPGRLTLHPELVPIFVVGGFEILGRETTIQDQHQIYYDLVAEHPDIFPGFYLLDYEDNIRPKMDVMQSLGFA